MTPTSTAPAPGRGRGAPRILALLAGASALAGFLATHLYAHRAEEAFPPLGRRVEVQGLQQHVLERGAGPDVVLLHGAYGALQDFEATILDEAARRYRCVLWDRPGHGYSERPASPVDPGDQARLLLGVLDELGVERPLLVGFSYGGAVALAAALDAPERIRGVVLINTPTHPWPDPVELQVRLPGVPVLGTLLTEVCMTPLGALVADASVERAFDPLPVEPSFASSPVALALRPASLRANAEDLRNLKPFLREQSERYGDLGVPVTMLVSEDDLVVSPTLHSRGLERATPAVEVVRVPRAGHQLLYTHPRTVLDAIDATMGRTAP